MATKYSGRRLYRAPSSRPVLRGAHRYQHGGAETWSHHASTGLNREKLPLKMQKWDIVESPAMNAVDYPQEVPRELPHREAIVLI